MSSNRPSNRLIAFQNDTIQEQIIAVRGHRVMLDRDLAILYGVTTGNLNKAVARNRDRFPEDFMFQLSPAEAADLIFQSGISKRGGTRHPPFAFTEQGVAMLSGVLRSDRAIQVNIQIMRAFVALRTLLATSAEMSRKLDALEKKYDGQFKVVFEAIRNLMHPPTANKRQIGFHRKEK